MKIVLLIGVNSCIITFCTKNILVNKNADARLVKFPRFSLFMNVETSLRPLKR